MQDYYWAYVRLQRAADYVCSQMRDGTINAGDNGSEIIRRITHETGECEKTVRENTNITLSIYNELYNRLSMSLGKIADYADERNVEHVGGLLNISCTLAGLYISMSHDEYEYTRLALKAACRAEFINRNKSQNPRTSNIINLDDYRRVSDYRH